MGKCSSFLVELTSKIGASPARLLLFSPISSNSKAISIPRSTRPGGGQRRKEKKKKKEGVEEGGGGGGGERI